MSSTTLFNPTQIDMDTYYAGLPFKFPAGQRVRLKTIRKTNETLVAEDIAMKCWLDLSPKGLIMVNEDDPQSLEEMREEGARLLEAFIRENNRAFNENQITLANEGRPKQKVPKDLRELNVVLRGLIGSKQTDEDDIETTLMSDDRFKLIKKQGVESVNEMLAKLRTAMKSGDVATVQELLADPDQKDKKELRGGPGEPGVGSPAEPEDSPEAAGDAMETGILDPEFRSGHEPGRPARVAARQAGGRPPKPR